MILLRATAALVLSLLAALPALTDAARDLPLHPARTLKRDIEAGTWMSLALSPDGRTIAFDLLGEIYTMPASGGRARRLLGGMAFETQPTFSPDGRWIAFVSDRSGSDNLWIARADGSALRQLTFSDDETVYTSPEWRADGKAVFVSHYRPDLNSYELLLQPLDGKGIATVPIRATRETPRADWQSALGASVSRDGRWLYYARRAGSIDFDVPRPWTIVRRDLASGAEAVVITGFGGRASDRETFFRPQVSPDGTQLAYATHRARATELRLRDLATGQDRSLGLAEADAQQSSAWQDLLPRYAFTPDGTALIVSYRGGFERRPVDGSPATRLPFTAPLALEVGPSTRTRLREPTGPVQARLPQAAISSPDGKRVAFSAFGRIHVQPLDGSASARALADPGQPAFQPSWSPDGATIAFVTWSEAQGGAVWTAPADGSGRARRVDNANAFYTYPVFDPAGGRILAHRSAAAARRQSSFEYGFLREAELVALPLGGGAAKVIAKGNIGGRLQFDASGRVFVMATDGLSTIDLATGARAPFVQVKGAAYYFQESPAPVEDIRVSPDGAWLVAQVAQQLHLVAMPAKGSGEIDLLSTRLPHRRLTDVGADYFQFTRDGGLEWSVGPQFWRMDDLDARPRRLADLAVALPRAIPKGSVVLRGARVLTMAPGDRVIENADVVVTGDRITAIGPRGTVPLPEGATLRDVTGKILVPGFIDVHDHIGSIRREVLSFEDWSLRARLAYGVTTAFDPSTLSIDMLSYQDAIDAGLMLGPRLRSTGPALFSWNRFASLGEVRDVLRRYRDAYGLSNIKQYRTGNRRVRQWVARAARELGLLPTTEGALSLKLDLTQIIDGFAGNEHALPAKLEDDVLGLLADMRTSYTTTLMVTNSGAPGADWFTAQRDPFADARTARFWPPSVRRGKLLDRPWVSLTEQRFPAVARDAAALAARGGLVGMGSHAEVPGIGYHWEMEAHTMGGMTPLAVLHAATAGSAETIGRLDDLGTLEAGKLADMVILDRDPRDDIRNTTAIAAVMRGGTLYDGDTLAELWPNPGPAPQAWFAAPGKEPWLPTVPAKPDPRPAP